MFEKDAHVNNSFDAFSVKLVETEQNLSTFLAHMYAVETAVASASGVSASQTGSSCPWTSLVAPQLPGPVTQTLCMHKKFAAEWFVKETQGSEKDYEVHCKSGRQISQTRFHNKSQETAICCTVQ